MVGMMTDLHSLCRQESPLQQPKPGTGSSGQCIVGFITRPSGEVAFDAGLYGVFCTPASTP